MRIGLVAAALHLTTHIATATPVPADLYFPTTAGATWVYEQNGKVTTVRVVKVEDKGGRKIVTTANVDGAVEYLGNVFDVSEGGIVELKHLDLDNDPPLPLLRLPAGGEPWTYKCESRKGVIGVESVSTTHSPEAVEVPSGKYMAVRVVTEGKFAGNKFRVTSWFAPNVGLVRQVQSHEKGNGNLPDGGGLKVLKSFTPGKTVPAK